MKKIKSKHLKLVFVIVLLTTSFFIILTGMNLYRYYKLKSSLAENLVKKLNDNELQKLKSTVTEINNRLLTSKDMGENGLFDLSNPKVLRKKLLPFLENQDIFSSIILADDTGREFLLIKESNKTITQRTCKASHKKASCTYEALNENGKIAKWQEDIDYDPRQRPWFKGAISKKGIYWSPVYRFFKSQEPGITAAISWKKENHYVFALDIPIKNIKETLAKNSINGLYIFLYNPEGNIYISKDGLEMLDQEKDCQNNLVCLALKNWTANRKDNKKFMELIQQGHKWYYTLKPLSDKNSQFLLGILITEKALFSDFKQGFLGLDPTDIAISFIGSILILALFWKSGLISSESKRQEPILRLHEYLSQGEGNKIEFKSTVRTNLKTNKVGKEIELAWLKAIVAFLNTNGGVLLIGVDDRGKIIGIEADNFQNEDKCQLHIKNLINQHIGAEFSSFISVSLVNANDKTVVMIECQRAKEPVFLRIGRNEEFYIRSGPSSMKLSPSQTVSYVMQNKK